MKQKTLLLTSVLLTIVLIGLLAVFVNTVGEISTLTQSVHQNGSIDGSRNHFVLIVEEYNHPYWNRVAEGALDSAAQNNVLLEIVGPFRSNISEHKKMLEKAVAAKVDGIFVQGLDAWAETPIINKAISKGIAVITVDTDAVESQRISYVGTDNYESGVQLGKHIVNHTASPQEIGIISGAEGATNQRERVDGLMSEFNDHSGFRIVATGYSNISRLKAAQTAEKMLNEHPNITMMIGTSGLDALGIYDAVKHLQWGDILIYGYDDMLETLELIRMGHVQGTVVQKPYTMGQKVVELMVDYTNGKKPIPILYTDTKIVTKEDMSP